MVVRVDAQAIPHAASRSKEISVAMLKAPLINFIRGHEVLEDDQVLLGPGQSDLVGLWDVSISPLIDGAHKFTVSAAEPAKTTDASTGAFAVAIDTTRSV